MGPGILDQFKSVEAYGNLDFSERLVGALYVILLGMGIVFLALVILLISTKLMSALLSGFGRKSESANKSQTRSAQSAQSTAQPAAQLSAASSLAAVSSAAPDDAECCEDEALIAVIAAAVAASMNQSVNNLVVTRIRRLPETAPAWNLRGRTESMNNSLR